jgi:amino acid transporter
MRLFGLLSFQHIIAYLFPSLLFIVMFGLVLGYAHLHTQDAEKRKTEIIGRFAEDIKDRNAPFPLAMILIIAGVFIWGFLYILMHGILGVKI